MRENSSPALDELNRERAEHEKLKKERTRLKLQRERGEVVDVKAVRKQWGDMCANVRKKILALEVRIPQHLLGVGPGEWARVVHDEIYEVLNELSDYDGGGA